MLIARSLLALLSLLLTLLLSSSLPAIARFVLLYSCFSLLGSYFSYLATRCSVFFVCSARYSLDATHGSYFTFCFLLIRCLLVLTRCYLSLIATDRPRLVLAARCLRTVKSGLLILRRCKRPYLYQRVLNSR